MALPDCSAALAGRARRRDLSHDSRSNRAEFALHNYLRVRGGSGQQIRSYWINPTRLSRHSRVLSRFQFGDSCDVWLWIRTTCAGDPRRHNVFDQPLAAIPASSCDSSLLSVLPVIGGSDRYVNCACRHHIINWSADKSLDSWRTTKMKCFVRFLT